MPFDPGTRLGPYEIVAPLGAGGMGEVYRAHDSRLGRDVAIKVISNSPARDRERLARFEQEARAAGALNHPGICAVLDVGTQDGAPFVVMELLEGETLRERLQRGPLPWRKVVEHAIAIAQALAAAHEKGIVHRDLKPENLFFTRDGRVKVLDFGLAKLVHPEDLALSGHDTRPVALTGDRSILGTAGYMAPEQVRGQATDARTDLFALGTVLYEMLTGARAFTGDSFVETGNAILNHEPALDAADGREIPAGLRRVVARCLEKNPEQRFRSAGDLAFHLESLVGSDAGAAPVAPAAAARRAVTAPVASLALVAALIVGLAGGAVVAWRMVGRPATRTVHFPLLPPSGGRFQFILAECTPFALSPDGGSIAFVAGDSSGARRLWLRSLGEPEARGLIGTEGARSVFWAPDGRSLGFFVRRTLKRYDFGSAGVVSVCEAPAYALYSGSWGRDGTILFAAIQEGIIYRVPESGGEPRVVLRPDAAAGRTKCAWPEFLPDGRRFLYFMRQRDNRDSLALGDLAGTSRPLMPISSRAQLADAGTLLYVSDGTLVSQSFDAGSGRVTGSPVPIAPGISHFSSSGGALFSASPGGTIAYQRASDRCRLARFDEKGDELARVGTPADYLDGLDLTADGRRLLCARRRPGSGSWDIWLLDVARGTESRITGATAVTEAFPVWLPGERSFAFLSTVGSGLPRLHRRDLANGEVAPLLPASGFQTANDVSPDGRTLLYEEGRPPDVFNLWVLPLGGGKPRRLTTGTSAEGSGQFSPDGRNVAMIADEGERYELSIVPFPGPGERVRVSSHGATVARWSRDGSRLYYVAPDGHLMVATVRTSPSLQVGEPRALFHLGSRPWKDFVIAPDGRFLALVPEVVQAEEPVDVVAGWKPGAGNR